MPSVDTVTTSWLLGNLHCPSCVAMITDLLHNTYQNGVVWVSPNLVTSVVTVEHEDDIVKLSVGAMEKTLRDAGYDIRGVKTTAKRTNNLAHQLYAQQPDDHRSGAGAWLDLWHHNDSDTTLNAARVAHLENCEACRSSTHFGGDAAHGGFGVDVFPDETKSPLANVPESLQVTSTVEDTDVEHLWRATLSIDGMTCASCVNNVTNALCKQSWISNTVVNLITNSASVDYTDQEKGQEIITIIEDAGYDAVLDKVVDLKAATKITYEREIQIHIKGIHCPRCPERISRTLRDLSEQRLTILQLPTPTDPLLQLRYSPKAPSFTIRHILKAISATDSSLKPTIYHPPSLEEKSKVMRAKHHKALWRRMILTGFLTIPTFVLGIVYMTLVSDSNATKHYLMMPWTSGISRLEIILCVLATPVYFFAADAFHRKAIKELRTTWCPTSQVPLLARFYKFGSMNLLMSLGTTIAYFSSIAQMISAAARGHTLPKEAIYFDSVVFLTLFLLGGRLIESYSKSKTGNAVEALIKLRPATALIMDKNLTGETITEIPLDQLEHDDLVRVMNGSSPPADGVVVLGESSFDESSLTGESRPVKKQEGDEVFSGTINKAAVVTIRVTSTSGRSMLDQIVEVVREGQTKRAPIEQIADLLTGYFVPAITLIAILTWIVWMVIGYSGVISPNNNRLADGGWAAFAFHFAIAVFVVACPCGLGLAAPTAIFVGGGLAAKHGILVKGGGEAFEKAHKIDCVVFDKTGTLTVGGEPQITDSIIFPDGEVNGVDERILMGAALSIEENSSHPIAKAIVAFCKAKAGSVDVNDVEELPGKGIKASCSSDGEKVFDIVLGNEHLLRESSVGTPEAITSSLKTWKSEAKSVVVVAIKLAQSDTWTLAAALSVSDPIREEAAPVIHALQARGTQVWMLSGDNETTAKAVAERIGIPATNVLAEVLPSEKAAKITYLQATVHASAGHGCEYSTRRAMVAMVGDGINDSPALTTADVGIAIGSGSDVAISSADFVLATSNLTAVLTLLDLSKTVFRRIKLNFGWAVVYNMLAVPIAAGCLYPITTSAGEHITLDPVWASLAMALSSISVVMSSLALKIPLPGIGFRAKRVA